MYACCRAKHHNRYDRWEGALVCRTNWPVVAAELPAASHAIGRHLGGGGLQQRRLEHRLRGRYLCQLSRAHERCFDRQRAVSNRAAAATARRGLGRTKCRTHHRWRMQHAASHMFCHTAARKCAVPRRVRSGQQCPASAGGLPLSCSAWRQQWPPRSCASTGQCQRAGRQRAAGNPIQPWQGCRCYTISNAAAARSGGTGAAWQCRTGSARLVRPVGSARLSVVQCGRQRARRCNHHITADQ